MSLLGPPNLTIDGQAITGFTSNKARALLFYLAVEASTPHRRSTLAALLWPERPEELALGSLRRALLDIRQAIDYHYAISPFLVTTRNSVQCALHSDWWCDVAAFQALLRGHEHRQLPVDRLRDAAALYRGQFMEGFALDDSPAYEEWLFFKREELNRQAMSAFHSLVAVHKRRGEHNEAESYVRRQLALEPWNEDAHCELMRLLASSGQRSAALGQYEVCRRALAQELEVEPAKETIELYENIRGGKLGTDHLATASSVPAVVPVAATEPKSLFVSRDQELARLEECLLAMMAGQGRVVFVTGDAGSGKTSLLREFARRAMDQNPDLLVAEGSGDAYTGAGNPYLPFREIMEMLAGDVEAKRSSGSISTEQARRLWDALPTTVQSVVSHGPELIDLLVPGAELALRARAFLPGNAGAPWLDRLDTLVQRRAVDAGQTARNQEALFQQVARVLQDMASHQPLLLLLDDLQWSDEGSIGMLFHLGRRLPGSPILIVGAYRTEEVVGRLSEERHPLEPVVNELRRYFGDFQIDLARADGRSLVESLVDAEPNSLGSDFRGMLYQHTAGHALFSVELLHGMRERGDLVRDEEGRWVEASKLGWEKLPPRVEAAIAERIGRLPGSLQSVLRVASVEGEEFTAEVVAQVLGVEEQEVYRRLSGPLSREHQLVTACSLKRLDGRRLSRYRFRHQLFQEYLYRHLDEVERAHRHEAMGNALETLYGVGNPETAAELAWHFERAGLTGKAIGYLLQAGWRAEKMSAYREAILQFSRGLGLVESLPEGAERLQREFELQSALSNSLLTNEGWGAPERAQACERAFELSGQIGGTNLLHSLYLLADLHRARGQHSESLMLGERMLRLAQQGGDPEQLGLAHSTLGATLFFLGDHQKAGGHFTLAIDSLGRVPGRPLTAFAGSDVEVICRTWLAWVSWTSGYADQALEWSRKAVSRAREIAHPFSLAFALVVGVCWVRVLRREFEELPRLVEEVAQLVEENSITVMKPWATVTTGLERFFAREMVEGVTQMREGVDAWMASGARTGAISMLIEIARAHLRAGQPGEGLEAISEAFEIMERTSERCQQAELYRLQGELRLASGAGELEAEESFQRAVDIARRQEAKSWELRAATSLARLWHRQGKSGEAGRLLEEICGWFAEVSETADLREAKELLGELSAHPGPGCGRNRPE